MKTWIFRYYGSYETASLVINADNYLEAKQFAEKAYNCKVIENKTLKKCFNIFGKGEISKKTYYRLRTLMNKSWMSYNYERLIDRNNCLSYVSDDLTTGLYLVKVLNSDKLKKGLIYLNSYSG